MIYMFLSNNPSSGEINSSNLSCLNFTVAMVAKMADKIGLKQSHCHFGPNLRLLETHF